MELAAHPVVERILQAIRKRPHLDGDLRSLLSRPWVDAARERAAAQHAHAASPEVMARAQRVLAQLDECMDPSRVRRVVNTLSYVSRHTSTYVVLGAVESAMQEDNPLREAAFSDAIAQLLAPEQLALLDGCLSTQQIGRIIDRLPDDALQTIDLALTTCEAQAEARSERAVDDAISTLALATRYQMPQKLLLMFLLLAGRVSLPPPPLHMAAMAAVLAVTPLPLVALVVRLDERARRVQVPGLADKTIDIVHSTIDVQSAADVLN